MTRTLLAMATALALATSADPAMAEVLAFRAELHSGGSAGAGIGGDRKAEAFHKGATGFDYGVIVGVEALFIDVWVQHDQHHDTDGLVGTWTQFMTGIDIDWDIGAKSKGAKNLHDGVPAGGYAAGYGEFGIGIGYGVGTGQQVDLPLDNAQLSDKMFVGQLQLGFGYRLTRTLSLGIKIPVQVGYGFKQGPGAFANDLGNHYQSVHGAALLDLRFNLTVK